MKTYYEPGYQYVDEAYSENMYTNPHHFHYYDSGMVTYKKKYIHLYLRREINPVKKSNFLSI